LQFFSERGSFLLMRKLFFFVGIFLCLFLLSSSSLVQARVGVGVGTGKIVVENKLKPGEIYRLPSISVLNTGDEPGEYEVGITYHEKQPELPPPEEWFNFKPAKFDLKPGEVKTVEILLNLPIKAKPGDYFAYVEGRPIVKAEDGTVHIGVAAAAKLYFTVVPSSILWAIYYKLNSFWQVYAPWPKRGLIVLGVIVIVLLFKKYFRVQINPKRKNENE